MIKITDPNYFLPTIQPVSAVEVMKSGANTPQLIIGICTQTGEKSDYVVKYLGAERMYVGACAKELIGVCIANQMGYNVPEPVQVLVSPQFIETLQGNSIFAIAAKSIGFNYGSSYIGSYPTFIKGQILNEKQLQQIPAIFAFDMFIQNADRNNIKPNMVSDGDKIYLFDHEMAFGFANEIPANKTPWIIRDTDMDWVANHFFYPYLIGRNKNFNTFTEKLDTLDSTFWQKLVDITPVDWKTDEFDKIVEGLNAILMNKNEFINQIIKRLK